MPVDEFQTARAFVSPVPVTGFVIVFCLLLNVVQSVEERVPVADPEASPSVRACPEIVRPFATELPSDTSPVFVPDKLLAEIFPANIAPAKFAYVDEAVEVET